MKKNLLKVIAYPIYYIGALLTIIFGFLLVVFSHLTIWAEEKLEQ